MNDMESLQIKKYNKTVIEVFELQLKLAPQHVALSDELQGITYKELNRRANQLAARLQEKGVVLSDYVALLIDPSIEFIICVLAIIKLGAAYLPIDAQAPIQRIKDILSDANPKLLITDRQNLGLDEVNTHAYFLTELTEHAKISSETYIQPQLSPEMPICMYYTSGSTGKPKGVIISHQAVVNLCKVSNFANVTPDDVVGQFSNVAFDACTYEVWGSLLNGAAIFIIPPQVKSDLNKLKTILFNNNITSIFFPTAYFHQIISVAPDILDSLKTTLFGGEQININLIKKFLEYRKKNKCAITLINAYGPTETTTVSTYNVIKEDIEDEEEYIGNKDYSTKLIHAYGPTETTTFSTYNIIEEDIEAEEQLSSIGKPIANTKAYVLNENFEQVAKGEVGELHISGINLAIGYHNQPELNSLKFIKNPYYDTEPYTKLYKTGDLVRELSNGKLLYMGRVDDQVKISGYRVHLSEIEDQLLKHPLINFAVVLLEKNEDMQAILSAYIVLTINELLLNSTEIREFLTQNLPEYMIPIRYFQIEKMSLNNNGKVDKQQLKNLLYYDLNALKQSNRLNLIENKLSTIFCSLLNCKSIDINRNLLELGINSLMIISACFKIKQEFNCTLEVSTLLTYPSIYKLSLYLRGRIDTLKSIEFSRSESLNIAVVGMACRLPKANSPMEYWNNLCMGIDCLTDFSKIESIPKDVESALQDKRFVPIKGIISDINKFDAAFFGINPADANNMDPQHRIFLECAWEALEHSGNTPDKNNIRDISVFAGMADSSYLQENLLKNKRFNRQSDWFNTRVATSMGTLSTQISYYLNLHGKSISINTACSTGLVAIEQACQDLILGNSYIALAGGIAIDLHQKHGYFYQQEGIYSADGKCRPFSEAANGTIFSDGIGVVVLKRLGDAIKDNDTIYAVIKGCGVNNDGSDKVGYIAPSIQGQANAIYSAIKQSQVAPEDITYIEGHGTATALGDVIEVSALNQIYTKCTIKRQYCALGSVKGNIGHTDIAAGSIGFIKTVLCLYNKKIPPTLYFDKPNPNINFADSPFYVNNKLLDWNPGSGKRYAGVSAFGVGGTNAHIILEEYIQEPSQASKFKNQLIIISAKNRKALEENVENLIQFLDKKDTQQLPNYLADTAYTLQTGRDEFQWRQIAVGNNVKEIMQNLTKANLICCDKNNRSEAVFMFPGQGTQYKQMGLQLLEISGYFSSIVAECNQIAKRYLTIDIISIIRDNEDNLLHQTQYSQIALFIIEYALAKLLISYGITPAAFIGHSIGEYTAACLAGVFSVEDAILLICKRGELMASAAGGEMLAIECTIEEFTELTSGFKVDLALYNSTYNCVASGSADSISQLEELLKQKDILHRKLKVSHAFHSYLMEEATNQFKDCFKQITLSTPKIPIASNLTGNWLTDSAAVDPDYWCQHLRHTVKFKSGIECLLAEGYTNFVEIGPGHSLSSFVTEIVNEQKKSVCITYTLPNHKQIVNDEYQLLTTLGLLWQNGFKIKWESLYAEEKRRHIALPTYAFKRQRYWIEPDEDDTVLSSKTNIEDWFYQPKWSLLKDWQVLQDISLQAKNHVWLIFKDHSDLSKAIIKTLQEAQIKFFSIESGISYQKLSDNSYSINLAAKEDYLKLFNELKNQFDLPPLIINLFSYQSSSLFCADMLSTKKLLVTSEIDSALAYGFYSFLYTIQAYADIFGDKQLKCLIVTSGTQKILRSDYLNPVNATLTGICRVVPQEHAGIKMQLLDLNQSDTDYENIIVGIINNCAEEEWSKDNPLIAVRQGYQWRITYNCVKLNQNIERLKDNGIYLFTGGLGGISLTLCEIIAKTVSKPVFFLLSRTAVPSSSEWNSILSNTSENKLYKQIKMLDYLQSLGAALHILQVDITQFESVDKCVKDIIQNYGRLDGVVHAAGIAGGGLIQLKTKEIADKVFAPKVHGTYNLARALANIKLDFVVLCSSVSSVAGEASQVDYCGANACLDSFATSNLFNTSHTVSINWNTWQEVGMAVETERPEDIVFSDRGNDITPQQGQSLFMKILSNNYSQIAVSKYDLLDYARIVSQQDINDVCESKVLRDDLNVNSNYVAPRNKTEEQLVQLWQDALNIEHIGVNDDFFTLGGHSLKALRLIDSINKKLNFKLTLQDIYQKRTIADIVLAQESKRENTEHEIIVPLKVEQDNLHNIFVFHPVSGMVFCYENLVFNWQLPISLYGLQDPSIAAGKLLFSSLKEMAELYLQEIKTIQPEGPYYLLGYSFGATLAYEVANLLHLKNEEVDFLGMIDGWAIFSEAQYNESQFKKMMQQYNPELPEQLINIAWQRMQLLLNHIPTPTTQDMLLIKATQMLPEYQYIDDEYNGWEKFNNGNINLYPFNANHETIINFDNSPILSSIVFDYLKIGYNSGAA